MASCKPKGPAKGIAAAPPEACGVADIDPKLEWHDGANSYIIRLNLPGNLLYSMFDRSRVHAMPHEMR